MTVKSKTRISVKLKINPTKIEQSKQIFLLSITANKLLILCEHCHNLFQTKKCELHAI